MTTMTTTHQIHRIHRIHRHEEDRVLDGVRESVVALTSGPSVPSSPIPVAFLDDGRRLFLVIDAVRGRAARIRSWGLEIRTDQDLIGDEQALHIAVRSTQRPTADAAEDAARYLLRATAK
ncbi:MAG: hypothetical protein JJE50_13675 [Actinomycetales bacterium]|nr:hypothetical protein [Actinomycetales bacterium]